MYTTIESILISNNMQFKEILQESGLSTQEIKVYLAGLESGPILASKLAKKTGFGRTNTYSILKSLEQKGLVSKEGIGYSIHFIMEPPSRLKDQLENKKEKVETLKKELEKILPMIKFTRPPFETAPKVRVFEGKEGMNNIVRETTKEPVREIISLLGGKEFEKVLDLTVLKHHIKTRQKMKIKNRTLVKKNTLQNFPRSKDREELRETRFIPADLDVGVTIMIWNNNVAVISSQEEDFGFIIESPVFSQLFKNFFDIFWKMGEKVG